MTLRRKYTNISSTLTHKTPCLGPGVYTITVCDSPNAILRKQEVGLFVLPRKRPAYACERYHIRAAFYFHTLKA